MAIVNRPFLSLPNEIRERICGFVLRVNVDDSNPFITPLNNTLRPGSKRFSCLAILATCRQILFEAFHVFYTSNIFNFNHPDHLYDFLGSIGPVRANEIRSVRCSFRLAARQNNKARRALSRLMRLERLSFEYDVKEPSIRHDWSWVQHMFSRDFCPPREFAKFNGLREVNFIMMNDTEPDESDKTTMKCYKDHMIQPNPKRNKPLPRMVDLFGGLKLRKQREPAAEQRKKDREERTACKKAWDEANHRVERRLRLERLRRQGEEARKELDSFKVNDGTDQKVYNDLTDFFSTEPWIEGAISA